MLLNGGFTMLIDVHHHFVPEEIFNQLEEYVPSDVEVFRNNLVLDVRKRDGSVTYLANGSSHAWGDVQEHLRHMDESHVEHSLLSVSCFQDWMSERMARQFNESLSQVITTTPGRFSGIAAVPVGNAEAAEREVTRIASDSGFVGIGLTSSGGGLFPDAEEWHKVLRLAAAAKLTVVIHPSWHPNYELAGRIEWGLFRTLGRMDDLAIATARILYSGLGDRIPELRLVVGHFGGTFPLAKQRLLRSPEHFVRIPKLDYDGLLSRVWFDSAPGYWQGSEELNAVRNLLGSERILFGSDTPLSGDPGGIIDNAAKVFRSVGGKIFEDVVLANTLECFPRLVPRV